MKKHSSLIILVFLSLFLVSACTLPSKKAKPEPFKRGILVGTSYFNDQAKISFSVPYGWDVTVAKDAQDQFEGRMVEADKNIYEYLSGTADLICNNPNTDSYVLIIYAPMKKDKDFDENVDALIDLTINEGKAMGIDCKKTESFDTTIGGRECRVDVLDISYSGVEMKQYECFCEIDSYLYMIEIVPNDSSFDGETFEAIIANFSATEE